MTAAREAVHREPMWRERSNFIIATAIDSANTDISTEQLWARKVDDRHFELCCIPFFAYDLALGDVVETDSDFLVQGVHPFRQVCLSGVLRSVGSPARGDHRAVGVAWCVAGVVLGKPARGGCP